MKLELGNLGIKNLHVGFMKLTPAGCLVNTAITLSNPKIELIFM